MIPFEDMDKRLAAIGKDRAWLSQVTPYKANSIRQALSPSGAARSGRLQEVLSRAIEDEEQRQKGPQLKPGFHEIFLDDAQLDRADRASRIVNAPSLADFCRDAILARADEILAGLAIRSNVSSFPVSRPAATAAPHDPEKTGHWLDLVGGVAAGARITSDCKPEPIPVPKQYDEETHKVWKVFGKSMEPTIKDGSLIVCRLLTDGTKPKKGTIVVYEDSHGTTLKEFGYRKAGPDDDADTMGNVAVLRSLNKAFPDVTPLDGGRIVAVYVETV